MDRTKAKEEGDAREASGREGLRAEADADADATSTKTDDEREATPTTGKRVEQHKEGEGEVRVMVHRVVFGNVREACDQRGGGSVIEEIVSLTYVLLRHSCLRVWFRLVQFHFFSGGGGDLWLL